MKKTGRGEQQRVKYLRCAGNPRQPFEAPDDELKNQVPFPSIGARSATEGPFNTLPSASKRDP